MPSILTPKEAGGLLHTLTCGGGGLQQYLKSFKICYKTSYSQANDGEGGGGESTISM